MEVFDADGALLGSEMVTGSGGGTFHALTLVDVAARLRTS